MSYLRRIQCSIVVLLTFYIICVCGLHKLSAFFVSRWWKDFKRSSEHNTSEIRSAEPQTPQILTRRWILAASSRIGGECQHRPCTSPAPESGPDELLNSASSTTPESVHLKLQEIQTSFPSSEDTKNPSCENEVSIVPRSNTLLVSEYRNVDTNELLLAIHGWNKTKLELFSQHIYGINFSQVPSLYSYDEREVDRNNDVEYQQYLELWKQSKFLTQKKTLDDDWKRDHVTSTDTANKKIPTVETIMTQNLSKMQLIDREYNATIAHLHTFLHNNITTIFNQSIEHYSFQSHRSFEDHVSVLKNFSVWFREIFPYYYDGCLHCLNRQSNQYFGSVYSNNMERQFNSGKTELYLCSHCLQLSRFPRYNDMRQVVRMRRGRCGEYSILMMLMLRTLRYETRYVVDRDDHVSLLLCLMIVSESNEQAWTEVMLQDQWIHIDPCEAAINEPLIYQNWGKNQTFILAMDLSRAEVEDVTHHYTSQPAAIYERRLQEGINATVFQLFLEKSKQSFQLLLNRRYNNSTNTF